MTRRLSGLTGAALFALASSVYVTWPQARVLATMTAAHHDAEFSIWRLQWIAHALATSPRHLFDPDIFHPATTTLAYSDATMLQGLLGAPLLWMGVPPVLVYNLLLLAGLAGSGVAMFVLARHLTGTVGPALVAAAVFTMAPYRIEHFMHLELQWAMFIPLTFWALHRTRETASWKFGALAGVFLWLQVLSSVYYGVFLALMLVVFVPVLLLSGGQRDPDRRAAILPFAIAAAVAAVLTLPYALPYRAVARDLGVRDASEIARYSATLLNYFSTSNLNVFWGWTSDRFGDSERRLFPGAVALILAAVGLWRRPARPVLTYVIVAAVAVELSFGVNGVVYRTLADHLNALQGFRSLSRFGIVTAFAVAMLSAYGTEALLVRIPAQRRSLALVLLVACLALEYRNRPMSLTLGDPERPPDAYLMLRRAPPGVVIELPVPPLDRLPGWEPYYQAWQAWHWRPLVNGYSGYYPLDYRETLVHMLSFPDDGSIGRLRGHDVRFVVIHRAFYEHDRYTDLMLRIARRPELKSWGAFKDSVGLADIFELTAVD
jgi:hypothetical protein